MRKLYTSWSSLTIVLLLGACSSVPVPFVDRSSTDDAKSRDAAKVEQTTTTGDQTGQAHVSSAPAVPTPPLNNGNQALFDRGVELMREQRHEAALVLFEELTSDQPELAGPWVNIGHIHLVFDEKEQAQAAFTKALAANPRNCDALNQMGVLARRDGQFQQAEKYYKSCIETQPQYANAQLNLAILYELYMGRLGEALAAYHDYQLMLPQPDGKVSGWVIDLERRVAAIAAR